MGMTVVDVREVWVLVCQCRMRVLMRVRLCRIHAGWVDMLMMGVMRVFVRMSQGRVRVSMEMRFREMEPHA